MIKRSALKISSGKRSSDHASSTLLYGMQLNPTERMKALGAMVKFVQTVQPKAWLRATGRTTG